jgi:hypothetical protein
MVKAKRHYQPLVKIMLRQRGVGSYGVLVIAQPLK